MDLNIQKMTNNPPSPEQYNKRIILNKDESLLHQHMDLLTLILISLHKQTSSSP